MLRAHAFNNNVRCELQNAILAADTTFTILEASAPFNNPPTSASALIPAYFTLVDNLASPTMIEIVRATGVSAPALGVITLTGVSRGRDGTSAQDWVGGVFVLQTITKEMISDAASLPFFIEKDGTEFVPDVDGTNAITFELSFPNLTKLANVGWAQCTFITTTNGLHCDGPITVDFFAPNFTAGLQVSGELVANGALTVGGTADFDKVATFSGGLVSAKAAPANSSASGNTKEIRFDTNYIYVCVGANNWKRVALSAF